MNINKYDRKALQQFKPATKLDKIKYWYMQEMVDQLAHDPVIELSAEEHDLRTVLSTVYGLLTSYKDPRSPAEVRKLISGWKDTSAHKAYRLVKMAQDLFGEIEHAEKSVMRAMQTEIRKKAISAINSDTNLEAYEKHDLISKHMTRIEQINHLEDKDTLNLSQILDMLQLPDTEFTTDTAALNDVEEAEYTDLSDES